MEIATASFDTAMTAESAIQALLIAGFPADAINIVSSYSNTRQTLTADLARLPKAPDRAEGAMPAGGGPYARMGADIPPGAGRDIHVYDRLTETFIDRIQHSNLPDDAVRWYQAELDKGRILVTVTSDGRMHDADRILTEHHGVLFGEEWRRAA